ncbi:MAG: transposase [Rhodospirillales bacterium]
MAHPVWVGIDVSGKQLDAGTYPTQQPLVSPTPTMALPRWRPGLPSAMWQVSPWKPTGGLERRLAHALIAAGHQVRVLNPKRVRDFAKSLGPAKNDRIDAGRIAHFAATIRVPRSSVTRRASVG